MKPKLDVKWLRSLGNSNIRLHGNRFIQIDLDQFGEERLHLWADHVPFAQRYPTPVHNHVFGFESQVLSGTLIDVPYQVTALCGADHWAMTYHTYQAQTRNRSDTILERADDREYLIFPAPPKIIPKDCAYYCEPLAYHASAYIGHAITWMKKRQRWMDVKPSVLCPKGQLPDNSFDRYQYSAEQLWSAVEQILALSQR